jgi:hypothetical protein
MGSMPVAPFYYKFSSTNILVSTNGYGSLNVVLSLSIRMVVSSSPARAGRVKP